MTDGELEYTKREEYRKQGKCCRCKRDRKTTENKDIYFCDSCLRSMYPRGIDV